MKSIIIVHAQIYEGSSPTFIDYVFTFYFLATDIKIGPMEAWFGSTRIMRVYLRQGSCLGSTL